MGNFPPSARARTLHALLQSRQVKVSEKEFQTHWEYLLQSNLWLIKAPIWDPSTWEKVLKKIRPTEVHEEKLLPSSLTFRPRRPEAVSPSLPPTWAQLPNLHGFVTVGGICKRHHQLLHSTVNCQQLLQRAPTPAFHLQLSTAPSKATQCLH